MTDAITIVQYELSKRVDSPFLDAVAIVNALVAAGYMLPQAVEKPKLSVVVPFEPPRYATEQANPDSTPG